MKMPVLIIFHGVCTKEYAARDSRIRWKKLEKNMGIAENTNQAFAMASGDFVGLLDHDDLRLMHCMK